MKNYKLPVSILILQIFILGLFALLTFVVLVKTIQKRAFYLADIILLVIVFSLFYFIFYRILTMPYNIVVKNNNSIKFISRIKKKVISLKEIKSIKYLPPKGEALGIVTITSTKGKLILVDIGQFHEFIFKHLKNK